MGEGSQVLSDNSHHAWMCMFFVVVFAAMSIYFNALDKGLSHINHQLAKTVTCVLPEAATPTTTVKK
jgi:hypothetical protein